MDTSRIEDIIEGIRAGSAEELNACCDELRRMWRSAPVDELLSLKEQFRKLGMEHREAFLEEALISIAEKRPEPFVTIATDPGHPLWRPALEVLSMLDNPAYLDLFISLIPLCPEKDMYELVQAISRPGTGKSVEALSGMLATADEPLAMDIVLALKRCGGGEMAEAVKNALRKKLTKGSNMQSVIEAVLTDMENAEDRERG